ncbi:MAG: F0F1-type ATP synthase assembly protein I [Myxococcota bacterium]|jgi:F0F1-type ATP synthase assembly protein I
MSASKLQKQLMGASGMVMEMSVLVILGALVGNWLDSQLQTSPLLLLLALGAALVLGMTRIIRTTDRLSKDPPR